MNRHLSRERERERTVQDFTPQCQTLYHVRVLPRVVVRETCAATPAPDREAVCCGFLVPPRLRWVEILLQVGDHAVTRVAVRAQERVVVPDAVQRLTDALPREPRLPAVLGGERLYRAFFGLDVALDLPPAPLIGDDLLRGSCDERVTKQVEHIVFAEKFMHRPNRRDAREPEHVAHFGGLAVLQKGIRKTHLSYKEKPTCSR
jgi:hypothetical protein